VTRAIEHLEEAEAALISYVRRFSEMDDDAEDNELLTVLMAVLRSVSRAAGALENNDHL